MEEVQSVSFLTKSEPTRNQSSPWFVPFERLSIQTGADGRSETNQGADRLMCESRRTVIPPLLQPHFFTPNWE